MSGLNEFTAYRLSRIASTFVDLYVTEGRSTAASYASKEVPRKEEQFLLAPFVKLIFEQRKLTP